MAWSVPMVEEVVRPAGLMQGQVVTIPLPKGEAFVGVSSSGKAKVRFEEDEGLQVMTMLAPALKAGVYTLLRLVDSRMTLIRTIDGLGHTLSVHDVSGHELHRSQPLVALLASDPESDCVVERARRLAISLARIWTCRVDASEILSAPAASEELETKTARYCLRASLVGCGILGLEDVVLVSLERLKPALPSTERLRDLYRLTAREAQVALLLAQGLSNRKIAKRLSLSDHTVRHHAESIFLKVGVHSRTALGSKLISEQH